MSVLYILLWISTLRRFQISFNFFFIGHRRTTLGWGGSTKNDEKGKDGKSRVRLSHCFVFVFLVCKYTTVHVSQSDLKLDVYVSFRLGFFWSKRVYKTIIQICSSQNDTRIHPPLWPNLKLNI